MKDSSRSNIFQIKKASRGSNKKPVDHLACKEQIMYILKPMTKKHFDELFNGDFTIHNGVAKDTEE